MIHEELKTISTLYLSLAAPVPREDIMMLTALICLISLIPVSLQQTVAQAPVTSPQVAPARIVAQYSIRTGTPIHYLLLDRLHHRLAAQEGDSSIKPTYLKWLQHGSLASLVSIDFLAYQVLSVDFTRRRVFYSSGAIYGDGVYLHSAPFSGSAVGNDDLDKVSNEEKPGVKYEDRVRVKYLIGGKQRGRNYRVLWPVNGDLGLPLAWGGVYDGNSLVKRFEVGYLPKQILYVPSTDQLWIVHNGQMKNLDGLTIPLPNKMAPEENSDNGGPQWGGPPSVVDTDISGKNAYYVDGRSKSVYKFSLATGAVLQQRSLSIVPTSIVVDDALNLIHLLDKSGERYITVRAF